MSSLALKNGQELEGEASFSNSRSEEGAGCYDFKRLDNRQQSKDQKMSLEECKLDLYCLARFENVK